MKSILFLIALLIGFSGETTSLKNKVDKIEITSLPFEITNLTKYPTPLYAVNSELASEISLHAYSDVNLKKRIKYDDTNCTVFRRFNTESKNYIYQIQLLKQERMNDTYQPRSILIIKSQTHQTQPLEAHLTISHSQNNTVWTATLRQPCIG